MMTTPDRLSSFAVAFPGEIGLPIIHALSLLHDPKPKSILALLRAGFDRPILPAGVKSIDIDISQPESITGILKQHEVDVLICTVAGPGVLIQRKLADVAKSAGVKLMVPSEFGFPTEGAPHGLLKQKSEITEYLKSIGLPFARFYCGTFYSWIPRLVGLNENGKFNIVGQGDSPFTLTAVEDIAGFIAYVTTNLSPTQLNNATFRLEGEQASVADLATIFNCPVQSVDKVPGEFGPFADVLQNAARVGYANVRWDWNQHKFLDEGLGQEDARLWWPGHVWKQLGDISLSV